MAELGSPDMDSLNFVQRYLRPSRYPSIPNEDGTHSTHLMASAETDGKYIAYPTIVQEENGELRQLEDDEAFNHAMETGEYVEFRTPERAQEWAEGGYKKDFGKGDLQDEYQADLKIGDIQNAYDVRQRAKEQGIDVTKW